MNALTKTTGLAIAMFTASIAAACGSAAPPVEGPETPGGDTPAGPDAPPSTDGGGETPPATDGGGGETPAAPKAENTPLKATAMIADIKKAGLDPAKLPPMAKLTTGQKKKIMPALKKSLGFAECNGCHVEGDYKKKTRNTQIAAKMWDEFVVPLRDEKGGPLFCDSCHDGSNKVLAHGNDEAVQKFMETDYEGKLTRADKEELACTTCHGDAMDNHIIQDLWEIQ